MNTIEKLIKSKYEEPKTELIALETEDVITTSTGDEGEWEEGDE